MKSFASRLLALQADQIAVAEIPFDKHSSYREGAAEGPQALWKAFHSPSANTFAENGMDIGEAPTIAPLGPLPFDDYEDLYGLTNEILGKARRMISLGGDHSITYPIVKAFARHYPGLTLLQLDAHPDLNHVFEGNRFSHACPFARIMEEGLAERLVQVGIRTQTTHQREQAKRFGVEQPEWRDRLPGLSDLRHPLYLTLDLDVLDPAFAPGVAHHEPGGLSVREVLRIIQGLRAPLVGADIVELNPTRDIDGRTAMVAAKFFREIAAHMLDHPLDS